MRCSSVSHPTFITHNRRLRCQQDHGHADLHSCDGAQWSSNITADPEHTHERVPLHDLIDLAAHLWDKHPEASTWARRIRKQMTLELHEEMHVEMADYVEPALDAPACTCPTRPCPRASVAVGGQRPLDGWPQ